MAEEEYELVIDNLNQEVTSELTSEDYLGDFGLTWEDLQGKKILDIGASIATFAKAAKDQGIEVVSVERDPKHAKVMDNGDIEPGLPYVQADAKHLPFPDNSFDVAFTHATLSEDYYESTEEFFSVIDDTMRVLKQDGCLYLGPGSLYMADMDMQSRCQLRALETELIEKATLSPTKRRQLDRLYIRLGQMNTNYASMRDFDAQKRQKAKVDVFLKSLKGRYKNVFVHEGTDFYKLITNDGKTLEPEEFNYSYVVKKQP